MAPPCIGRLLRRNLMVTRRASFTNYNHCSLLLATLFRLYSRCPQVGCTDHHFVFITRQTSHVRLLPSAANPVYMIPLISPDGDGYRYTCIVVLSSCCQLLKISPPPPYPPLQATYQRSQGKALSRSPASPLSAKSPRRKPSSTPGSADDSSVGGALSWASARDANGGAENGREGGGTAKKAVTVCMAFATRVLCI